MIEIFKNREATSSFEEVVASYSAREFDSPRRSTVLLLDFWRSFDYAVEKFGKLICADFSHHFRLHFEYSVPVQAGKSKKASYTDLMIVDSSHAIGLEAKYMEPPYPIVSSWIKEGPDEQNRRKILGGWLSLIQSVTDVSLTFDDVCSLPYQLIHRTASVCSVPSTSRYIVYQIFEPKKENYYAKRLQVLESLLGGIGGGPPLSFVLMISPFEPFEHYQDLLDLWDAGERKMSPQVTAALTSSRLARFPKPRIVRFA
jgi:hypothetical protein